MIKYEKVIYVGHPYGGLKENEDKVAEIIKHLQIEHPTYLFISPIHSFGFLYSILGYQIGIEACFWLLDKCDEMWVFGDYTTSKGCNMEAKYCNENDIPYFIYGFKDIRSPEYEYKGYKLNCQYSLFDKIYFGKLNISDLVVFESKDLSEIIKEFKNAVDEYLDFCKDVGKEPCSQPIMKAIAKDPWEDFNLKKKVIR